MKYSIIVPFYSHPIDSVLAVAEGRNDTEVIISLTGEKELNSQSSMLIIVQCRGCGYGEAVNRAVEISRGDVLIVMNDDIILENDFIDKIDVLDFDILIPHVIDIKSGNTESYYAVLNSFWYSKLRTKISNKDDKYIPGSIFAVKREIFMKSGMFDKDYFMYYEDIDLSKRIKKTAKVSLAPEIKAFHKHSFSDGGMKRYYLQRNRLLMILKNCASWMLIPFVLYAMTFENLIMVVQIVRQKNLLPLKARYDFFRMFPKFFRKRHENTR
ncbi:MAG: glycosyltransferase family 2 protein [bacterium]